MNFDRNTVMGFTILAVLFGFYFYFNSKQQAEFQRDKAHKDSITAAEAKAAMPKVDSNTIKMDAAKLDSQMHTAQAGVFSNAANGTEQIVTVENKLIKVSFTNKGGQIKEVELKKFKNALDSQQVKLAATNFDKLSYAINTTANQTAQTADLYFSNGKVEPGKDGVQVVTFELRGADSVSGGKFVQHQYIIHPDNYQIDFNINLGQPQQLLTQGNLNLIWQYAVHQQESDLTFEKQNTQYGYMEDGDFDYHTLGRESQVDLNKKVSWIGIRQRFFAAFLTAKYNFTKGKIEVATKEDTSHVVTDLTANMQLSVPQTPTATVPLNIYMGPADYNILKKYDNGYSKLINLGQGIYAFVRPINQYLIVPIFNFLKGFISSYGLVIAVLTFIIRLLISPLTYSSYLSGAKMKALRPEIATLREKHGGDQQAMSMEQMKLFREAGVNPMGGCIPALLQIPIFFSLYSFFNATVDLRGADFLWSKDLSAYDSIIHFGFNIPLLGDHLSLFTLLAAGTSMLISIYGMSMTPDQSNPMIKYMPYIMPVFLIFIFNKLPSGLTWYYTVSNIVTLALQFVIQNYIIDHDKVLAKIQETRKKPKPKSKWAERLEQMQEQQKQVQQNRNKK